MDDRVEKRIELKAPISRVWRALTDYREFGEWFRVKLDGPFVPGQVSRGQITYPGYEHVKWEAVVQKMEPERLFSFTWHPYAVDPKIDYSKETPTLVEFRLEKTAERHSAGAHGVRLRQDSQRPPPGSLPQERRRLDRANEEYREAMSRRSRSSAAAKRQAHAPVFAALGDETRLALVAKLCGGQPHSISQLTHGSRLTRQAITKHLRVLEKCRDRAQRSRGSREPVSNSIRSRSKKSRNIWISSPSSGIRHYRG